MMSSWPCMMSVQDVFMAMHDVFMAMHLFLAKLMDMRRGLRMNGCCEVVTHASHSLRLQAVSLVSLSDIGIYCMDVQLAAMQLHVVTYS